MYTLEATTNCSPWENILRAMTTELDGPVATWTSVGGYRSHYYSQTLRAAMHTALRPVARKAAKKKILWSRVLLPFAALACIFAYQANQNLETQYRADAQNIYHSLNR